MSATKHEPYFKKAELPKAVKGRFIQDVSCGTDHTLILTCMLSLVY
jgi:hypothetical protein